MRVAETRSAPTIDALNPPFAGTPGRLLHVGRDCSTTPVATGLPAPTSVAVGADGNAYVSIFGTSVGIGEVILIDLGAGGVNGNGKEGDG